VDFDELADVHVGVNLGGVQARVSEHLLDVTQVGAVLQQERRHRVAEQVATADLADAALQAQWPARPWLPHGARRHWRAFHPEF